MILQHDHFDLLGKVIFEKMVFHPPLKAVAGLQDEACFFHVINGKSRLYSGKAQHEFNSEDSFVMKCGSYLNKWLKTETSQPSEVMAIHLYPDVLKLVYEDNIPKILNSRKKNILHRLNRLK